MGYGVRDGLIEENKAILTLIQAVVVGKQQMCPLDPYEGMNVYQMQWHLRRVLKATEILNECEGRFSGLSNQVSIQIDTSNKQVIIKPRSRRLVAVAGSKLSTYPDEEGALNQLETSSKIIDMITFKPTKSFNEEKWVDEAKSRGWEIYPNSRQEMEGGLLMYGAEKMEGGVDPLGAYSGEGGS